MERKEIQKFVNKFLTHENGKSVEVITEYHKYNMDLVNACHEEIVEFFQNIYKFPHDVYLDYFLKDKNNKTIYELEYLCDLDSFEDMIGLLIASNILEDNLARRVIIFENLGAKSKYLQREIICDEEIEENYYLKMITKHVLPYYYFVVNHECTYYETKNREKLVNVTPGDYQGKVKELLKCWFMENKFSATDAMQEYFSRLLDFRFETVLRYAVIVNELPEIDAPSTLAYNMANSDIIDFFGFLDSIDKTYDNYTKKQLELYKKAETLFIKDLEQKYNQKKRHL